nr:MAG TPA: hypothetical protein [Caudoviricetes sp.]
MNNVTGLLLQRAPEFDTPRARARPHTLASFPLTESGGKDARVVWVVEYMYICDPGHFVADPVPVAGSDPTPRSASLRFGVGSLDPGPNRASRRRRGDLHPPGVPAKGAAALGRRSPAGPRAFSVPGGEAFLGSPC